MKKIKKNTNETAQSVASFQNCVCITYCAYCRDSTSAAAEMNKYYESKASGDASRKS